MVFEVAGAAPAPAPVTAPKQASAGLLPISSCGPSTAAPAATGDFQENMNTHASPVVRPLAREFSVNLAKVRGTGH